MLSYRYGYASEGIGKIQTYIAPYSNDPNRPVLVIPSSDGDNFYSITDGSTDIPWTPYGMNIEFQLTAPTSYVARLTPYGGTTRTNTGNLEAFADTQITKIRAWNYTAGSGPDYDVFFNSLQLTTVTEEGTVPTSDTITVTRDASTIDSDGDGISDQFELQYYGSITCAVANLDTDSDGLTALEEFIGDTDPTNPTSF